MTSINPINVNTQGIGAKVGYGAQSKQEKSVEEQPKASQAAEQTPVDAGKVLDYMSANAVYSAPSTKTVDPAKYVDKASEARIASFMGSFEDKVAEGLAAFNSEFAGMDISEGAKMAVVLKQVESQVN